MARFCTLFSGSSGNSTYIGSGSGGILVDAGVSCKAILEALDGRGIDRAGIRALFLTHEHIDHVKGVRVLLKKLSIPVYASRETLDFLEERGQLPEGVPTREITPGVTVQVEEMAVTPFATSHDSLSSCGYTVALPDGRRLAVATDLGHVDDGVHAALRGCDLVLLEANYDEGMLRCGPYPYPLKRRIASDSGHLSNLHSAGEAGRLIAEGTTRVVLGHLSKENNSPLLARETVRSELALAGLREGSDFLLEVAPRSGPGPMTIL